jgi:hypothetical protein
MNLLNSLYFPETNLSSIGQYPFFLLFPTIHLLRIAEHNIHGNGGQATDSFIKAGLCQTHTPSPLGNDLKRFTRLVNDIKNRKDGYASQLATLTLSAMSSYSQKGGDSRREIISSLLRRDQDFLEKQEDQKNLEIWQARLVLAIGEIVDHEEEGIARQLAIIKDNEFELFRALKGEDEDFEKDNPFEEISLIRSNMNPPATFNMIKRFLSWKRLYREGDIPTCDLLLTTSKDCADNLLESFDTENNGPAVYSGQLLLPAVIGRQETDVIRQIQSYQEQNRGLIKGITEKLLYLNSCEDPAVENSSGSIMSSFNKPWEKALESHFPENTFGRIALSFYSFSDTPCSTLLGADKQNCPATNGLLAVADITPGRS